MNLLGSITASPDPPGVDATRWMQFIAEHPNLRSHPPKLGLNPFTRGPQLYRPDPRSARIVIKGREIGAMSWAEDGRI
jgi:hypothetical protein